MNRLMQLMNQRSLMPDGKLPVLGDVKNQDLEEYINYKNGTCCPYLFHFLRR